MGELLIPATFHVAVQGRDNCPAPSGAWPAEHPCSSRWMCQAARQASSRFRTTKKKPRSFLTPPERFLSSYPEADTHEAKRLQNIVAGTLAGACIHRQGSSPGGVGGEGGMAAARGTANLSTQLACTPDTRCGVVQWLHNFACAMGRVQVLTVPGMMAPRHEGINLGTLLPQTQAATRPIPASAGAEQPSPVMVAGVLQGMDCRPC